MGITHSFLKRHIKNIVIEETNKHWINLPKLRQSKLLLRMQDKDRQAFCRKLSKQNLHLITRLLTGHNTLNGHLHKLGLHPDGLCRFCNLEMETSKHILMDCIALAPKRYSYLGKPSFNQEKIATTELTCLLRFLKATGLEDSV